MSIDVNQIKIIIEELIDQGATRLSILFFLLGIGVLSALIILSGKWPLGYAPRYTVIALIFVFYPIISLILKELISLARNLGFSFSKVFTLTLSLLLLLSVFYNIIKSSCLSATQIEKLKTWGHK